MNPLTQSTDPPHSSLPPPAEIGKDQIPGEAAEGTVLHIIEVAVKGRVQSRPDIPLRELYNIVKDFDVVRSTGRDVCKFFLDECIRHYRLPQDGSHGGPSTDASIVPSDGRSQAPSRHHFQTPPTSTGGGQPSDLALNDSTNMIEIILPNDSAKPAISTLRDGDRSYISQSIVDRCKLTVHGVSKRGERKVFINLRWRIEVQGRGRSFRIRNCLFLVNDGLETDLAIGRRVQERLKNQAGSTEDSYDPESSSEDEASRNGRRRPMSQYAETSSHIGSSVSSMGGNATSKDFLDALHRIMDINGGSRAAGDTNAHGNRQDHRDDPSPLSPDGSGRAWRRRRRDSDDEFHRTNRPRYS